MRLISIEVYICIFNKTEKIINFEIYTDLVDGNVFS